MPDSMQDNPETVRRVRVERWLSFALLAQWYASLAYAWSLPAGSLGLFSGLVHGPTFATGMVGGICTILPLLAARRWPGQELTAWVFTLCLTLVSLLWLRLDAGGAQMYLLVLAGMAALAFYHDPNLLMAGSTLIILHHAVCLAFPIIAPPGFSVDLVEEHAIAVLGTLLLLGYLIRAHLAPESDSPALGADKGREARVLVVDDDASHRVATADILEKLGCVADQARTGKEALDAIHSRRYDAVFMDCEMPVLNGYDATVEIRRRERGVRHTWIIALTSNIQENDRDICLVVGMDDYLTKPARISQIRDALKRSPASRLVPTRTPRRMPARRFTSLAGVRPDPLA